MNARDELADILEATEGLDFMVIADLVIKSGYRRPRTITTAEELDALHDRSVVSTSAGTIANLVGDAAYFFGYEVSASRSILSLPATVLYEPEQP